MRRSLALILGLVLGLSSGPALAYSESYHLERLRLQARAFLQTYTDLTPEAVEQPGTDDTIARSVEQQLEPHNQEATWAETLVAEDVERLLEVIEEILPSVESGDAEAYLQAKAQLDSMQRRLRVSTAAVTMTPEQRTAYDLMALELKESVLAMDQAHDQQVAAQQQQRRRSRPNFNMSFGVGWGDPFFYRPYYPGWGYSRFGLWPYGYGRRCR